jgi:uncharacterized membrane protein YGL010W
MSGSRWRSINDTKIRAPPDQDGARGRARRSRERFVSAHAPAAPFLRAAAARMNTAPGTAHFRFDSPVPRPHTPSPLQGVPTILATFLMMFARSSVASYLPAPVVDFVTANTGFSPSWALVLAASYCSYYVYLSPNLLGLSAGSLVLAIWYFAETQSAALGADMWNIAIGLNVVGWIAQFYGHGVHEGRSPALLDNLFQALFVSFFFVWIEVLLKLGFLKEFHAAVQPEVIAAIQKWRASQGSKQK